MGLYMLILITALVISDQAIAAPSPNDQCQQIQTCPNYQHTIIKTDDPQPTMPDFQNESQIAESGHFHGIKPTNYNLKLNFHNITHYNGNVAIEFTVIQATNRIMIHHGSGNPKIDHTKITVTNCNAPISGCIEKTTYLEANSTLIIDLKSINLEVGKNYAIDIGSFQGKAYDGEEGSVGIHGTTGEYSALTTLFQMRFARTAFPCFDHPALKASFQLCVEHPSDVGVASNTVINQSISLNGSRKLDCFEKTPPIPTYVFAFALMHDYDVESVQIPDGPKIELLAPKGTFDSLRWMLEEAMPVVQYMEKITNFKFPMKRLAFIAQYAMPMSIWGVENFGLITVDLEFMQEQGSTAYTILYHEIVHQWLGDVVTISDWSEICLQEGLTAYFEWKISADRRNGSLDVTARGQKMSDSYPYDPVALQEFTELQDIVSYCFDRPPRFFHMATKLGGFECIENFLAQMIKKAPFGTASIDLYDQAMAEACRVKTDDSKGLIGPGFIKNWFLKGGPVFLIPSSGSEGTCINIHQQMGKANRGILDGTLNTLNDPRPVPLTIRFYEPNGKSGIVNGFMNQTAQQEICGRMIPNTAFLIDPEGDAVVWPAYTSQNYRRIFNVHRENGLTSHQLVNLVHDFCNAMLNNILPLEIEPTTTKSSEWMEVFQAMKDMRMGNTCRCCLSGASGDTSSCWPMFIWEDCKEKRLIKAVLSNSTRVHHDEIR